MKLKKFLAGAFAAGAFFACGCNGSYCEADAMTDFNTAYVSTPSKLDVVTSGLNLFGPYFHADVDGAGQLLGDGTFSWEGKLNWIFTDKKTMQSKNENIPLYAEQRNGVMTLYVYRNSSWSKLSIPGFTAGIANALKTNDAKVLANNATAVKDAKIIDNEADAKKIRVTLDGKKLAGLLDGYAKGATGEQAVFMNRLKTAFNATDVTVDWDIKKSTNETVSVNVNLTPVVRAYAKGVLDEMAAGKIKLSEDEKNYYAALGYYAECPFYLNADSKRAKVMVPNLSGAKNNPNVFADIKKEIATTPTTK